MSSSSPSFPSPGIVSATWLMQNRDDPRLRIVDFARAAGEFVAAHVPSARYMAAEAVFHDTATRHAALVSVDDIATAVARAGIANEHTVVIYDDADSLLSSRLALVMRSIGLENVRVLDGGWRGWLAQSMPVQHGDASNDAASFRSEARDDLIVDTEWMLNHHRDAGVFVIDTRSPGEHAGIDVRAARGGRIPGSTNIEWSENFTADGFFKSNQTLLPRYRFLPAAHDHNAEVVHGPTDRAAPHVPQPTIVTYCQSGVRASGSYIALRNLGFVDVRVYLDSWQIWGNREDTPVEYGPSETDR